MELMIKSLDLEEKKLKTTTNFNGKKRTCQNIDEILTNKVLKPNTLHDMLNKRLCVSKPTKEFNESYRPCGIIFKTNNKPNNCSPLDMMALTTGKSFTSSDYSSKFLKGSKDLIFTSAGEMLIKFPKPALALKEFNKIRKNNGLGNLSFKNIRKYNEICFENDIKIIPVALFGNCKEIKEIAKKFNLPVFKSVKDFLEKKNG